MKTAEERLVARFRRLNENDRETVLALAEFLAGRAGLEKVEESIEEPLPLGRPDHETVVAAMRRLRSTYPMIEAQAHGAQGRRVGRAAPCRGAMQKR
ncbi:MAG: hypothetical protein HND59_10445 [Pseudomonadota bacterium]|nr:MAG: hypothetical protein HND59_10445 [Pseudomonadota bacterium]